MPAPRRAILRATVSCVVDMTNNMTYIVIMIRINIAEAKAHLSRHLEKVEGGETIILCRRNVPIAEIRPIARPPEEPRPVGIDRGMVVPPSFFEVLPEEILDAFEGGHSSP